MKSERIRKIKTLISTAIMAGAVLSLSGCVVPTMNASQIRQSIDTCTNAHLENIVFMRADKTVLHVDCTPVPSDIQNAVTVKHPIFYAASPGHTKPEHLKPVAHSE